ncbi:NADP-dependent oxidoreductase domain-containing protein [Clohesyomyces aquaticus]|uniref:NADP-dependent oxidoreductase domain-containing protein n=1 Tax=Clohesyomyces aquaticus TaxID=1231657 RepID=A0A1Y1ZYE3_9PLEO|nr:NADP-dependent oxidoreductase domain-containing protein [Clohesyomyces aquaticus]
MHPLPTRQLGKNGLKVSALGFGAMGLSASYGKVEQNDARFAVLDRALELGSTFWDTSDVYADSEDLLKLWFERTGKRDKIFLATKFAVTKDKDGKPTVRSDAEYVKQACEKSLNRLGVSKIDLYYCHRVDKKTPIEQTVEALAQLKNAGKIGAIGLSEVSAATIRRAEKVHHINAVQLEYSPFALDIESEEIGILKTCRELGIAVVAYSPLGRGFLTGQIKSPNDFEEGDFRKYAPRYNKENFPKNLKLVEKLQEIAEKKGCSSGQLSLAWLLAQGDDIIPIPGTKKVKYLEENVSSIDVRLTAEEVQQIRAEIEKVEVTGDRYPPFFAPYSFGDTPPLQP